MEGRGRQISEFEASLVYKVSSRTARATQRNPVSKKQKKERKREREKEREGKRKRGKERETERGEREQASPSGTWQRWGMPLIPALGRQRQADF